MATNSKVCGFSFWNIATGDSVAVQRVNQQTGKMSSREYKVSDSTIRRVREIVGHQEYVHDMNVSLRSNVIFVTIYDTFPPNWVPPFAKDAS